MMYSPTLNVNIPMLVPAIRDVIRESLKERKIIETITAMTPRADYLSKKINEIINEGFQPFGNVYQDEDKWFCLLMVKYEQ